MEEEIEKGHRIDEKKVITLIVSDVQWSLVVIDVQHIKHKTASRIVNERNKTT